MNDMKNEWFEKKEKETIDSLKKSLRGMKKRFSKQKNFNKNTVLFFKELYQVLQYEDEYLAHEAFKAYTDVVNLLKFKTARNADIELFLFTLDAFMAKFAEEANKIFR